MSLRFSFFIYKMWLLIAPSLENFFLDNELFHVKSLSLCLLVSISSTRKSTKIINLIANGS